MLTTTSGSREWKELIWVYSMSKLELRYCTSVFARANGWRTAFRGRSGCS
jgi:hypothetical protein